jgi:hypothetical protein
MQRPAVVVAGNDPNLHAGPKPRRLLTTAELYFHSAVAPNHHEFGRIEPPGGAGVGGDDADAHLSLRHHVAFRDFGGPADNSSDQERAKRGGRGGADVDVGVEVLTAVEIDDPRPAVGPPSGRRASQESRSESRRGSARSSRTSSSVQSG